MKYLLIVIALISFNSQASEITDSQYGTTLATLSFCAGYVKNQSKGMSENMMVAYKRFSDHLKRTKSQQSLNYIINDMRSKSNTLQSNNNRAELDNICSKAAIVAADNS